MTDYASKGWTSGMAAPLLGRRDGDKGALRISYVDLETSLVWANPIFVRRTHRQMSLTPLFVREYMITSGALSSWPSNGAFRTRWK